jgi:hypothetical protein
MASMKGCDNEATCVLNNQDVLVKAYLAGYRKASCAAGDMPVSSGFLGFGCSAGDMPVSSGFLGFGCSAGDMPVSWPEALP